MALNLLAPSPKPTQVGREYRMEKVDVHQAPAKATEAACGGRLCCRSLRVHAPGGCATMYVL